MNKTLVLLSVILGLFGAVEVMADVTITEPVLGNDVSADKCVNSTNGAAYTALGDIVIAEGATGDFKAGASQTLVLTIPDGWRFNGSGASVIVLNSRDISSASLSVTASKLTVTFSVGGTTKFDQLTIHGVQVQALDGTADPNVGYILNLSSDSGTASIAGVFPDLSTFGLLNTTPGAPRTLGMSIQPSSNAMAGVSFPQQPLVMTYDQFGNQCFMDVTTVVTASRGSGTGSLLGTKTVTAIGGEFDFNDLSYNVAETMTILFTATNLNSVTSAPVVVGPGLATRLVFTAQPGAAVSGSPFGNQPALKSQDQFGNDTTAGLPGHQNVTLTLSSGTGPLLGDTMQDIGTNGGNGVVVYTNLEIDAAGLNKQLTASSPGFTNAQSSPFLVSGTGFSGLLVVAPGETYAPGTPTGKAGTPISQAPGVPFLVTVNAVDPTGNLINTVTDVVNIAASDLAATLPANAALTNGTRIFSITLNTLGSATITASDLSDNTKASSTSSAIPVAGLPVRLTVQTQPSASATAGAIFAQQPVVRVEDGSGNLISSDNGRLVTAARGVGTGVLQGTLTARTVNGLATFTNLSYNVAEGITIAFSAAGLTNASSDGVMVSAATANHLVFAIQPGGLSRAGSVLAIQPVLKSQDAYGNLSTVGLPANLQLALALTSGSGSLAGTTNMDMGTASGNGIAIFTNIQCSSAGSSKQLTAMAAGLSNAVSSTFSVGGLEPATSIDISADTAGGTYTTLSGPAYYEAASGDVGAGTIILNAPAGFSFDTGGIAPTVLISRLGGAGGNTNNIDRVASGTAVTLTLRTTNQITLTVTNASSGGVTCSMTWTNVRVRPNLGTPLANGSIAKNGTSTLAGVTNGSTSLGQLNELAGMATRLVFTRQPGSGIAGTILSTQPIVRTRDQFGNDSTSGLSSSKVVSLGLNAGTGPLLGVTSLDIGTAAGNGIVTFTNLEIDSAGTNKQLSASAPAMTNGLSSIFTVGSGAAMRLTLQTQPSGTATAGANFAQQPVIRIEDNFGNLQSSDNTTVLVASRASGSGVLQGSTSLKAVNGIVSFTNLSYNVAETITVGFASGSLAGATSSNVVVSPAAASRLTISSQPSATATAGVVFAQQPVLRIEDQFGNLRSADNSTVVIAARSGGSGALQGTTNRTAVNGIVAFANLSHNVATNITINFSSGTLAGAVSSAIMVSPAAASRLTIQTQPSASAIAGVIFAQQPVIRIEDSFGNLRVSDNGSAVTASRNAGSGALQGSTNLGSVNGVVVFTNLSHAVATNITIAFASGGLPTVISSNVVVSVGPFTKLQLLVPGETADPGSVSGKIGAPSIETAGSAFSVTVNAVDANWNRVTNVTDTVGISSSDINAVLPANAALAGGTKSFSLTLKTAPNQTVTASDVTQPARTANTSPAIAVVPAAPARLTIQTQPSTTATAGIAFSQQPVVRVEDAFGNLRTNDNSTVVTASRVTGSGVLQGTTVSTASNGLVSYTNLSHNVATNITIQFSSGTLTNATSGNVAVSAGVADHLTVQMQPSSSATAGAAFAQQPVVRIEDAFGNLRAGDSTSVVTAARNLGTGTLQGNTAVTANGGVALFTNLAYTVAETINVSFASGSMNGTTSSNIVVGPASASRLSISRQPSANAVAGVMFAQQPLVRVEDAFGNLRSSDNSTVVSAARGAGSGSLQGTTNLTAINGVVSFTNLSHAVATNITITFNSGSLTGATSSPVGVSPGSATRLVFTAQPGSAVAGSPFGMQPSIKTQDQFGNDSSVGLAASVSASVTLSSGSGPLTGTMTVNIGTNGGNGVGSFSNLQIDSAGTNKQLTISAGGLSNVVSAMFSVTAAPADHLAMFIQPSTNAVAGTVFGQQPGLRVEDAFGNLRNSDNTTVVVASRASGSGVLQGNTSATAVNGIVNFTNLSYTVAETITLGFGGGSLIGATSGSVVVSPAPASRLSIATQPSATAIAGSSFAQQPIIRIEDQFGNLRSADSGTVVTATRSGGSGVLQGTTNRTAVNGMVAFNDLAHNVATNITISFSSGTLAGAVSSTVAVSPAAASRLTIQTQPSATAVAGVAFAQQPVIRIEDAFGNLLSSDNRDITAVRNAGSGSLQGSTTVAAVNGMASFTNLLHNVASTITINFGSPGLAGGTSVNVVISPGPADHLKIQSQPSVNATAGVAFAQQPIIRIEDQFGNLRTSDNATTVSASRANGTGSLQGSTNITALGGLVTFTNLAHTVATNITIQFVSASLPAGSTVSDLISVSPAAAGKLTILAQPSDNAVAGVAFSQQPILRIEDAFGNLRNGDSTTVVTAARAAGAGTLQGALTAVASNGVASFANLAHTVATNITILFTSSNLTSATSTAIAVSPGAAARLTLQTQPSSGATAGLVFAQQPVVRVEDGFGNLILSDNSSAVTATISSGSGVLQGSTTAVAHAGLASFINLSYNVAETITLNFASGSLTVATSGNVVVGAAGASRLTIQQQPAITAPAGAAFAPQPVIRIEDPYGNLRSSDNATVITATRLGGNGSLQGTTNMTAAGGIVTFTNLAHTVATNITVQFSSGVLLGATSTSIAVTPGAASRLGLQTQPSAVATAGTGFAQQPVVRIEDAFGNCVSSDNSHVVSATRNAGSGTLQGTTSQQAANGLAVYTDLAHNFSTNISIGFSSTGLTGISSSNIVINPGAVAKLQLLVPGESSAPGTVNGRTGSVLSQTAGTSFNVTINAVDAFWNVVPTVTDTINLVSSDANASLPASTALSGGSKILSLTLKTAGSNTTVTASDVTRPVINSSTSPAINVNAAVFAKLRLLMPGESPAPGTATGKVGAPTAQTAGTSFSVAVSAVDANWNVINSVNDVIGITSSDPNASLQPNTALTAGSGIFNLTFKTAGTRTVTASDITDATKSAATGSSTVVNAGPFTRLQVLVAGETGAPGTLTGKTGVPTAQTAGGTFSVTVNSVDANWNTVNSVSDVVAVSSSDLTATLPANAALASGTLPIAVVLNSAGTNTITATDISDSSKAPGTSSGVVVGGAYYSPATGGNAIAADTANGTPASLSGPTYSEKVSGNVGTGTMILKAPAGFVFDMTGTAPAVIINRLSGSGSSANNINGVTSGTVVPMTSVTTTQLVFTVTSSSASGIPCGLVWTNVRVRAVSGTPLASGNLTMRGTANVLTVFTNSNFGSLAEVPGLARKLAIQTQPGASAIAGMPFAPQPVVQVQDQFGNLCSGNNGVVITAARNLGGGTLQGATSVATTGGLVSFTNLYHTVATNITIDFSGPGLTNATSSLITVGPAAATALAFATQPGSATAGAAFGVQPVVRSRDAFGNNSTVGIPASLPVSVNLSSGSGPLQGTLVFDAGNLAANGVAGFSDLRIDVAGTNKQLTATCAGLSAAVSTSFSVSPGPASRIAIQTQPSATATAGVPFAQQPILRIEDNFGNLRTGDNSTAVNVARGTGSGVLQGSTNVTANAGIVSFSNLNYTKAETINLSFASAGLTGATSSSLLVNPGVGSRLTLVTQPSSTATAGIAFAQQPVLRIEDQYGNLRSGDNSTIINAARGTGTGILGGTTTATASAGIATFGDLSYLVAEPMTIVFGGSGLSNTTSGTVIVGSGPFKKLLVLAPGESVAVGTVNGKSGTPVVQAPDAPFTITVNAVDDNWNTVNTITDRVGIASSELLATLPASSPLAGGSKQFVVTLKETGTNIITATDLDDPAQATAASSGIPVLARYTSASGGQSISADTTGGLFTSLTGPTYSEIASGEAGIGTIVLNAPTGFIFDTGAAPTVRMDRLGGSGINSRNINGVASGTSMALSSITSTQLTFTVTSASASGIFCKLTWQNVRVRPGAGTPLAMNQLTKSGTSVMAGVTNGISNFGTLREVAGAASQLALQTQPSVTATAGVFFAQQPMVQVRDQFGNLRNAANGSSENGRIVNVQRWAGGGAIQGQTNAVVADGRAVFTNLYHTVATNITLSFGSAGLLSTTSAVVTVNPAQAVQLVFANPPAIAAVGSALAPPPLIYSCDPYGNKSALGLPSSTPVNIRISSGGGSLLGITNGDIGSSGLMSFTNLSVDSAGNKQLTASASGLTDAVSPMFTVAKGEQVISFGSLGTRTYGDLPFPVSATASSGLPISFAIVSGPATLTGSTVTITGAGTVVIRADQAGNPNWNGAVPVQQSFVVTKATITVTAEAKTRVFGAPNPTLTASYTGFVNGDDMTVITGTPAISTTATGASSVLGSPYPIAAGQGTLSAANYNFAFVNGALSITAASSSATLSSSANPIPTGSNVTFVATVASLAPGSGVPNGSVTFKADGTAVGPSVSLSNGVASFASSSLAHGTHLITVEYSGEGNFYGSTNSLAGQIVDSPPTALLASYQRSFGSALQIPIENLLTNFTTDADGDGRTLLWLGSGTNGASISISGNVISYQPSRTDPNRNTTDCFAYSITDGFIGGMATNKILVTIIGPDPGSQPPVISEISFLASQVLVRFTGIRGYTYHVERAAALSGDTLVWSDLGSAATDEDGNAQLTDAAPLVGQAFYRVMWKQ